MQILHEIFLPQDIWEDFIVNLTRFNTDQQAIINSLLDDISHSLDISRTPQHTLVKSDDIDEASILAALDENIDNENNVQTSKNFAIQICDFLENYDNTPFISHFAGEDHYSKQLMAYSIMSSKYTSTDIFEFVPAA